MSGTSPADVTAAPAPAVNAPLAALVTGHVLQDGELVLLIIKPSVWYILLSSLRFAAVVLILIIAAKIFRDRLPYHTAYVQAGILLIAARVMWAVLQWMGRFYILTDMRVLRLSGVFRVDIAGCPLRKVARTRLIYVVRERLLGLGSIEIIPHEDVLPIFMWQTIARPVHVHEQLVAAINRARQSGRGGEM